MTAPLISIIMPCYNAAATLTRSCESIIAQTYANWELIIIDDGSQDDSVAVANSLSQRDSRIACLTQPNQGAGPARNHGLRHATGEWIAFLDSDDTWEPNCLQALSDALVTTTEADLAYCGWQNLYPDSKGEAFVPPDYENEKKQDALLGGCRWPIHGALTRKAALDEVGGFDEQWTSCMDYDLWLRLASFRKIVLVPQVLAYYHHHDGEQITHNKARIALNHWRIQKAFLARHPEIVTQLGQGRIRELVDGELLHRGYKAYWARNLEAARTIFRQVMKTGYGSLADWKYMLPALLPAWLHLKLINALNR